MSKPLGQRLRKLELARNPPVSIEDLLKWCDDSDDTQLVKPAPGENAVWDFIRSIKNE